jgi:hypothetical protein
MTESVDIDRKRNVFFFEPKQSINFYNTNLLHLLNAIMNECEREMAHSAVKPIGLTNDDQHVFAVNLETMATFNFSPDIIKTIITKFNSRQPNTKLSYLVEQTQPGIIGN